MTSFADLGVSGTVVRALEKRGITEPFAVQERVIPDALAGRDVLVRSRTGSGKTLGFAIPIVERLVAHNAPKPSALVLAPTRELAQQVAGELAPIASPRNLRVALAYGGVSIGAQANAVRKAHIVVATPGRLEDLLSRGVLSLEEVTILVLDEADHMLDMGFLPQVDAIVRRIPADDRQTMLFSATLDGEVGAIAKRYTRNAVRHEIASARPAAQDVAHSFVAVGHDAKAARLAELLRAKQASTLVFVRTKHGCDRLVRKLEQQGLQAVSMHGNKTQGQRERALAKFSSGRVAALIATDVAARGLDVDNIARVVNFDVPDDDKAFVHRVGRTGRAGRTGVSITFVAPEQQHEVAKMAARLKLHKEFEAGHGPVATLSSGTARRPAGPGSSDRAARSRPSRNARSRPARGARHAAGARRSRRG